MQVSDKLIKPLTEAKYLNADNVSRYRCIMRIFFGTSRETEILAVPVIGLRRNDKGSFFCRLQTRAVSAGSHNVDRMEESEYDPGYEKGGIH